MEVLLEAREIEEDESSLDESSRSELVLVPRIGGAVRRSGLAAWSSGRVGTECWGGGDTSGEHEAVVGMTGRRYAKSLTINAGLWGVGRRAVSLRAREESLKRGLGRTAMAAAIMP